MAGPRDPPPTVVAPERIVLPPADESLDEIGGRRRYLVVEQAGRGTNGVVFKAWDRRLHRVVALKVVPQGSPDESQRLMREAKAMARLSHPNVATIYDADLQEGVVVLALEFVPGTTLRGWLDEEPRPWAAVLAKLCAAGRGLAGAHERELVHRDFKLDNVLLGDDGRVLVADFGLARIPGPDPAAERDAPATADSGLTEEQTAVLGTPLYMAPEQWRGEVATARSDQYAFCVAVWRALTGQWPFEGSLDDLAAAKEAGPPVWPAGTSVPPRIAAAVRRGLAPDPSRRFEGMRDLLAQLEGRAQGRRRLALAGVAAVGVLGAAWAADAIGEARARARCAQEGQAISAVWNDGRDTEISRALQGGEDSYAARSWQRSRERIDRYAREWAEARTRMCERAAVEMTLSEDLAASSRACLEEFSDALDVLLEELAASEATIATNAATATASLPRLALCTDETTLRIRERPANRLREPVRRVRMALSSAEAANAMAHYEEGLARARAVIEEAEQLPWPPLSIEARLEVAYSLEMLGRDREAEDELETAFFAAATMGLDILAVQAATVLSRVTGSGLGRPEEALRWNFQSEMLMSHLGIPGDHLLVAHRLEALALVQAARGSYDEAEAALTRALPILESALGSDHPDVAGELENLGILACQRGRCRQEGLAAFRRALVIKERSLGPNHPDVAATLTNIGSAQLDGGDLEEARAVHERAVPILENALGPDHPRVGVALDNLGRVHAAAGHHEEALALHRRALAILERAEGEEAPAVARVLNNVGTVQLEQEAFEDALASYRRAYEISAKTSGPDHPETGAMLHNVGLALSGLGRHAEAVTTFEHSRGIAERSLGPDHPLVAEGWDEIGAAQLRRGEPELAVAALEKALAIRRKQGPTSEELDRTRAVLHRARSLLDQRDMSN